MGLLSKLKDDKEEVDIPQGVKIAKGHGAPERFIDEEAGIVHWVASSGNGMSISSIPIEQTDLEIIDGELK